MNAIFARRSIRQYTDKSVENEKIEQLLRAAMQAPSAGNQRPWEFIVVQDKTMLEALAQVSPYAGPVKGAHTAIVILGNAKLPTTRFPEYMPQDLATATQNLWLTATELGLGAVWLGVAPLQERMIQVRKLFNLPETIMPFAIVALGYPAAESTAVDRYEPDKVHYNSY